MQNNNKEDIQETPEVPSGIKEAASRGKLVIFVGAGVSRLVGGKSWDQFANEYLEYIKDQGIISYREFHYLKDLKDPRKILSICQDLVRENNLSPYDFEELFKDSEVNIKNKEIYYDLYNFNAIYITTNYDNYLDEIARQEKNKDYNNQGIYYKDENLLSSNLKNGNVLHLHGSVKDKKNMVISIEDYMKKYVRESEMEELLRKIFEAYTVLFVGYGLEEYEILEFIINKSDKENNKLKHYLLQPIFKEDIKLYHLLSKYYMRMGIKLIPYSISKKGYDQLKIVIKNWAEEIRLKSKPENFLDRKKIIDEVVE